MTATQRPVRFRSADGRGYWDITASDAVYERMETAVKSALDTLGGKVIEVHPHPERKPER